MMKKTRFFGDDSRDNTIVMSKDWTSAASHSTLI